MLLCFQKKRIIVSVPSTTFPNLLINARESTLIIILFSNYSMGHPSTLQGGGKEEKE